MLKLKKRATNQYCGCYQHTNKLKGHNCSRRSYDVNTMFVLKMFTKKNEPQQMSIGTLILLLAQEFYDFMQISTSPRKRNTTNIYFTLLVGGRILLKLKTKYSTKLKIVFEPKIIQNLIFNVLHILVFINTAATAAAACLLLLLLMLRMWQNVFANVVFAPLAFA